MKQMVVWAAAGVTLIATSGAAADEPTSTPATTSAPVDPPAAAPPAAATPATPPTTDTGRPSEGRVPTDDPTGGAYTSPTLLFIPAGAMPVWNVRVTASSEFQGPSESTAGANPDAAIRPGLGVELGLPLGFAVAAGSNWVGGDVNADTGAKDFNLGISPFAQLRYHIFGDTSGMGFQLGTSFTYKKVGFEGDPGEGELGLSAQYRRSKWEAGLQAVAGKDFATTSMDVEAHAYALYRVIPQLGLGAAGQVRDGVIVQTGDKTYDMVGGGIASLTLGRYQLGALGGATSLGLDPGQVGGLAQVFGSARF
jgi:hypothetical protein